MGQSVKFYTQVLGLKEVRRFTPREGTKVVFLKGEGKGMLELVEGIDKFEWKIDSGGAILSVCFEVPDLNAAARSLQAKGVNFSHGPMEVEGGTKLAFLKDPDGVEVELIQKVLLSDKNERPRRFIGNLCDSLCLILKWR